MTSDLRAYRPWKRSWMLLAALAIVAPVAKVAAQPASDPDWPCVQRLMPEISPGMVWPGPPLDDGAAVQDDTRLHREAMDLAARRVPVEEATQRIDDLAKGLDGKEADARLTGLFLEILEIINNDRASIMQGIRKFSKGQRALADKIKQTNEKLEDLPADQILERDALAAERDWDVRLFEDRRSSLTYLCEQPVLLEQRAFALGRTIAAHLE